MREARHIFGQRGSLFTAAGHPRILNNALADASMRRQSPVVHSRTCRGRSSIEALRASVAASKNLLIELFQEEHDDLVVVIGQGPFVRTGASAWRCP